MPKLHGLDLFSGAGGTMSGLVRAALSLGFRPDHLELIAVNHWEIACASHAANHPFVKHLCRSIDAQSVVHLAPWKTVDVLVASPECIHFSKARGGAPVSDQSRTTAHSIVDFVSAKPTKAFLIENVPDMASWGPLDLKTGRAKRDGTIFKRYLHSLEGAGYLVEPRIVNCAEYGDPQTRERLLIMGVHKDILAAYDLDPEDPASLPWPEPTHGPNSPSGRPFKSARAILDLDHHGPTVASKRAQGKLKEETLLRIEIGREKFGGEPFIIRRRQHENPPESDVKSVDWPLHTVTAGSSDIALITSTGIRRKRLYHRALSVTELKRAFSLPDHYVLFGNKKEQVRQIGNAVPCSTAAAHLGSLMEFLRPTLD